MQFIGSEDRAAAARHLLGHPLRGSCAEFDLVAAACCWPGSPARVDAALAEPIDWRNLLAVVKKQRVAGLVAHALLPRCAGNMPKPVADELRRRQITTATQAVAIARAASALTTRLEAEGVTAAVLKGATVARLAFGDAAIRHARDIDLFVPPAEAFAAHEAITRAGYASRDTEPLAAHAVQRFMRDAKHLAYAHPVTGIQVELHWRLYDNAFLGTEISPATDWQRVEVGFGLTLRTLPSADLLLYLCGHGASHGWFRLKWLADVAAILGADPMLAERLLTRAADVRLSRAVMQALALAHIVFGVALPASLPRLSLAEKQLVRVGWDALTRGHASTEPQAERFASTKIRSSQLLLSWHPGYLATQLRNELMASDPGPSLVGRSHLLAPLSKLSRWTAKKLLPRP